MRKLKGLKASKALSKTQTYVGNALSFIDGIGTVASLLIYDYDHKLSLKISLFLLAFTAIILIVVSLISKRIVPLECYYIDKASISGVVSYAMRSCKRTALNDINIFKATTLYTIGQKNKDVSDLSVKWQFECHLFEDTSKKYSMYISTTTGTTVKEDSVKVECGYNNNTVILKTALIRLSDLTYDLTFELPQVRTSCNASCSIDVQQSLQFDWNQSEVFIVDPRNYSKNISLLTVRIVSEEAAILDRTVLVFRVNRYNCRRKLLKNNQMIESNSCEGRRQIIEITINLGTLDYNYEDEFFIVAIMSSKDLD